VSGERLREAVYGAANVVLARFPPSAPLILAFRRVPEAPHFSRYLDVLRRLGRRPVPLQAVAAWARGTGPLVPGAVALTFDDGYRSQRENAALVLRQARAPATFFAVAGALGGTAFWRPPTAGEEDGAPLMTADDLAALAADGFEIGSQSTSHRYLAYLRPEDRRLEIEEGKARLEAVTGSPVRAFRYPFGSFDREVVRQVEAAGFTAAVAAGSGVVRADDLPLLLPRVEIPGGALGRHRFAGHVRGSATPLKVLARLLPRLT